MFCFIAFRALCFLVMETVPKLNIGITNVKHHKYDYEGNNFANLVFFCKIIHFTLSFATLYMST